LVFDVALDFLLQLYYYACSLACLLAKYTTSIIRREREREKRERGRGEDYIKHWNVSNVLYCCIYCSKTVNSFNGNRYNKK